MEYNFGNNNSSSFFSQRQRGGAGGNGDRDRGGLPDTACGAPCALDFYCAKCKNLLITSNSIYRINGNCVWAYQVVQQNVDISHEIHTQPYKSTADRAQPSQSIYCCNCSNHVGYYLAGYNCSITGELVQYKMIAVSQNGTQKMLWRGEKPVGVDRATKWRSDKRVVEDRLVDSLAAKGKHTKDEMRGWKLPDLVASFNSLSLHTELSVAQSQKELAERRCRELEQKLEEAICPVCLEENVNLLLKCGHRICNQCRAVQIRSGRTTCPICRADCPQAADRRMY